MTDSTFRVVPAVEKAARILAELGGGDTVGISELARRIAASKGTVRDILFTLAAHGLVERTSDGRFRREAPTDLSTAAAARLAALTEEFGETAILGIVRGERLEIAATSEPPTDLHMSAPLGRRIPLRAGAHGKVLAGRDDIGYDDEEYLAGVRAAAAPVVDASGRRVAAVMVVGFKERIDLRKLRRIGERCAEVARDLSAQLAARAA
jgi:DNA-binding IclR family transcriptional regulator